MGYKVSSKSTRPPTVRLPERQQRMYDFLQTHPVGVLSTVNEHDQPHGTVIYFLVNPLFEVSFLTKTGTQKHDNLMRNNQTTLTIFDPVLQTTVEISGHAAKVTDSYDINGIAGGILAASLRMSQHQMPPITKLQAGPYTAFTIRPTQIRMAVYARPDPGDYDTIFESIESFELHP